MTNPSFTPGPWRVVEADRKVIARDPESITHDNRPIAECHDSYWARDRARDTWGTDLANAHLIAAAPELYEALVEFVRLANIIVNDPPNGVYNQRIAMLAAARDRGQAAIAKAEGRTP
jgi:hypothetical protein